MQNVIFGPKGRYILHVWASENLANFRNLENSISKGPGSKNI
jgi:hypothetical protein